MAAALETHSANPRISFQLLSPDRSVEEDNIFILTHPQFKQSGSGSQGSNKSGSGKQDKKGKALPNLMEKSMLGSLRAGRKSKNAWAPGEIAFGTMFGAEFGMNGKTGTQAYFSSGDNPLFHLPALNAPGNHNLHRQYLFSRDSTRPKPRKDAFKVEVGSEIPDSVVTKRVEDAMAAARKLKDRIREDRATGVPVNFDFNARKDITFVFDDDNITKEQRRARKWKEQANELPHYADFTTDEHEDKPVKTQKERAGDKIPGVFKFPKESDFIPCAKNKDKQKISPIHVDWGFTAKSSSKRRTRNIGKPRKSCGNPVTGGLNKVGSSVSKRQGKVLGQGDIKVAKVWGRPSTKIQVTIPSIQMAREDVRTSNNTPAMASLGQEKPPSTRSSSQKSERVERASFVEVSSMSDRLTEIMEEPEEEEEE